MEIKTLHPNRLSQYELKSLKEGKKMQLEISNLACHFRVNRFELERR